MDCPSLEAQRGLKRYYQTKFVSQKEVPDLEKKGWKFLLHIKGCDFVWMMRSE